MAPSTAHQTPMPRQRVTCRGRDPLWRACARETRGSRYACGGLDAPAREGRGREQSGCRRATSLRRRVPRRGNGGCSSRSWPILPLLDHQTESLPCATRSAGQARRINAGTPSAMTCRPSSGRRRGEQRGVASETGKIPNRAPFRRAAQQRFARATSRRGECLLDGARLSETDGRIEGLGERGGGHEGRSQSSDGG